MKNQSLTIQEAATFLGVSTKTLRRWDASGTLQPERTVGNQRRYTFSELQAFQQKKPVITQIPSTPVQVPSASTISPLTQAQSAFALASASPAKPEESNVKGSPYMASSPQAQTQTTTSEETLSQNQIATPVHAPIPEKEHEVTLPQESPSYYSKEYPKDIKNLSISSHPRSAMALAGAISVILLFSFVAFGLAQTNVLGSKFFGNNTETNGATDKSVLAAGDTNPVYRMQVNVPSMFGKQASFLDSVAVKKGLTVNGLSVLTGGVKTENASIDAGSGQLTASNVIYSLVAGANVTIAGDPQRPVISAGIDTPFVTSFQGLDGEITLLAGGGIGLNGLTITNTGVLTVQGETGAVEFEEGAGIVIDGLTITNSDPGSAQKIFGTFSIGGTDITAGSNTDTFTFAAGSGITLTPNASGKSLTIDATAASSAWSNNGTDIYYNLGNVGIGTSTPGRMLDVTGTGRFGGAFTLSSLGTGIVKSDATGLLSSSALNLASADVTGTLPAANGGTGVGGTPTNGQILIGNGSGYTLSTLTAGAGIGISNGSGTISIANNGVLSITGTANQVTTSGATGAITLSLPQDIHTGATPTFASLTLTANTNQLVLGSGNTGTITMAALTSGRTYTLPDQSGEICVSSGNCTGVGGSITGSGTTNYIPRFTSATGLGDSSIYDNGKVGIGTTSPQGLFSVSGGVTGLALVSLNETGNQDILVGSASGTTRFVFDRSGNLNLIGGGLQFNGTNVLSGSTLGSTILTSSLTSVGTLNAGSIGSGFGAIDVGADDISGGNITATGTTGFTASGNGAGLTFSGTGNHIISASSGVLQLGAATLTGAITGNGQNVTGLNNLSAAGTITFSGLTVDNGLVYTNASGVLQQAAAGTSGQILVANGSGNPTFVTVGTDATIDATGALTIAANAVALGTDTTGNYVSNVSGGSGIAVTGSAGEGWTPALALSTLTANWDQTGAFDIVLNNAASELQIKESTGNTFFGTIDVGDLSADRTYTFPDTTGTICLVEAGNCAGSGTGVTTPGGTANRLVKFTGSQSVGNASVDDLYTGGVALTIDTAGRLGIGTPTPTGLLTVNGGTFGGNAAAIFNQTGASSNDIISASASGTTKFTINNNGNLQFAGNTSFLNTLTSLASVDRTYTLPDASGTICLTTGNCAGVGGGLTGSGTIGQIAYFNGTGTLTSEASGFAWDAANNRLGLGNDTPTGQLDVTGANLGKALVVFNETGDQNILVGSASGTTRFAFDRSGNLNIIGGAYQIGGTNVLTSTALGTGVLSSSLTSVGALASGSIASGFGTISTANTITGTTINGTTGINTGAVAGTQRIDASGNLVNIGTIDSTYLDASSNNVNLAASTDLQFNSTTVINSSRQLLNIAGLSTSLTPTAANTYALGTAVGNQFSTIYGQNIFQNGNQVCDSSGNCSGLTVTYWDQANGALSPKNSTVDLLVGGTSTESAKFAVLNVNPGSGTPTASVSAGSTGAAYITAAGTLQTTANQNLTIGGNTTGNITLSPLNGSGTVTSTGNLNLASGKAYQINGVDVLTATSLGSGVIGSSLTSVGALASGSIASGFGTIATANTITGTTINGTTGINTGATAGTQRIDASGNLVNIGTINASGAITFTNLGAGIVKSTAGGLLSSAAINLASGTEVTGTLGAGNGGTGFATYTTGDLLVGNGSSTLSKLAVGIDGQILSVAGGTPSWISSSSINYWQRANGAIAPLNITDDLLLGSTATTSAKFAFINNIGAGTPTASISANSGDNAVFLTGSGNLGTTNNQTLTLGGSTTGDILLNDNTYLGSLANGINVNTAGAISDVNGSVIIADNADVTGRLDVTEYIAISGTSTGNAKIALSGTVNSSATSSQYGIQNQPSFTPAGASLTNIYGFVNLPTIAGSSLTISNVYGGYNRIDTTAGFSGTITEGFGNYIANPILGGGTIGTNVGLYIAAQTAGSTNYAIYSAGGTNFFGGPISAAGTISDPDSNLILDDTVDIGSVANGINITTAGVISDNNGNISLNDNTDITGTLGVSSTLTLSSYTTAGGLLYTNGVGTVAQTGAGTGAQCLFGGATPTWGSCAAGVNLWQQNNGALSPFSDSLDLLVGGTSTTSAKFAFINSIGGGVPTASIAGTTTNVATSITGNGAIGTTNKQTLSLGTASTGNVSLTPGGTTVLTALASGYLGIGTTTPTYPVSITATAPDIAGGRIVDLDGSLTSVTFDQSGMRISPSVNPTGNTNQSYSGALYSTTASHTTRLTGATLRGLDAQSSYTGSGTLGTAVGGRYRVINSAGTITNAYGVHIDAPVNTGILTNTRGLYIASLVSGTQTNTPYGIYQEGSTDLNYLAGRTGIGSAATSPQATLDVRGNVGTLPVASISGQTSHAGLIVDNNGLGDLFTASKSGATKFTVMNNGNVRINNLASCNTIDTDANGVLSCGTDAGGENYWQVNSGAVSPFSDSLDLLIGGTSTTSAKFAFINSIGAGVPTASIAGTTTNVATSLTGNGALGTTNKQTLSLGTASTGNVVLAPGGVSTLTALASGNVGIGTSNPASALDVVGTIYARGAAAGLHLEAQDNGGNFYTLYSSAGELTFYGGLNIRAVLTAGGNFGLGLNNVSPRATLDVQGTSGTTPIASFSGQTTNAGVIIDNNGLGDLFTASKGGATKFTVKNNGDVQIANLTTAGGVLYTNGAGTVAQTSAGTAAQCLMGGTTPTWGTCALGQNLWQQNNGAISPFSDTLDLLVGGTSTASAKFAITGVVSGTPVATMSATTNNNGLVLDAANASIQSLRNTTLTLGGNTTGNIALSPNNGTGGSVIVTGRLAQSAGAVALTANAASSLTTSAGALTLTSAASATWSTSGSNQALSINASGDLTLGSTGSSRTLNLGNTNIGTFNIGASGDAARAFSIGTAGTTTAQTINIGSNSPGSFVNLKGATSTLDLGSNFNLSTTNGTLPVATISGNTSFAGLIVDNNGVGDLFTASKSGAMKFAVKNNGDVQIANLTTAGGVMYTNGTGTVTQTAAGTSAQCLLGGATPTWGTCALGQNLWQQNSGTVSPFSNSLDLLVGGTSTASAKFAFINSIGAGVPTASIAGTTTNVATFITGNGTIGTTNNQTLTIGGTTTGNIILAPNTSGGVGIGTVAPIADLHVQQVVEGRAGLIVKGFAGGLSGQPVVQYLRSDNSEAYRYHDEIAQHHFYGGSTFWNTPAMSIKPIEDGARGLVIMGNSVNSQIADLFQVTNSDETRKYFGVSPLGTAATATISALTSHAGLVVDNNGTGDIFTASKSGKTFFTVKNNGVIQMGNTSDGLSFDYLNGGPNYAGRARPTKQIVLSPEYSGGIITASGSATTDGDFTADASASATTLITLNGVANNYLTYYEWSSAEATTQDYTVGVRVTLPADFSSWTPGGSSIQVLYNTELTTSDSSKVDMYLYPSNSSTPTVYSQAQTSATAKTWTSINVPATDLNDGTAFNTASQSAMLYLKLSSKNNNHVQIGDIILNYLSKF